MDEIAQADKQRSKAAQRRQREDREDLRWLLGQKRGRRIVWRLLEQAGVFRSVFNQNAMAMAFSEGRRDQGLRLLATVQTLKPEAYALMQAENTEHDDRDTDADSSTSNQ